MEVLESSAKSNPNSVAGALAEFCEKEADGNSSDWSGSTQSSCKSSCYSQICRTKRYGFNMHTCLCYISKSMVKKEQLLNLLSNLC